MAKQTYNQQYVYGDEPDWTGKLVLPSQYQSELGSGLYYYGNCINSTKKKEWAIKYLTSEHDYSAVDLEPIPDFYLERIGAIHRMIKRGFKMNPDHMKTILAPIPSLIEKYFVPDKPPVVKTKPKVSVDVLAQGEIIDNAIDKIANGEQYVPPEILESLSKVAINTFIDHYSEQLREISAVLYKKDKDLVEAYTGIPQSVLRGYIKLYTYLLKEFKSKIVVAPRKPRKKKVIPRSKQVKSLNYMSKCDILGVSSIKPEEIIGARKLLVFNTNNRALMHIVSNDSEGLGVKGSTLIRFDEKKSTSKTIRKPEGKIKEFNKASSIKATKLYEEINAVGKSLTGRINKHCIILKVY